MKKTLIILSAVAMVSACKTTPINQASDSEVQKYFQNLEIKPQNGSVKHIKFGQIKATEEPYATEYNECQNEAFAGKVFTFGTVEVTNPKKLSQYSDDSLIRDLKFILAKRKDVSIKPVFDDPRFKSNLEQIRELKRKTLECVKKAGWSYLSNKEVSK
ncbi:hypothetical protein BGP78_02040 [Pseudoalteromonas sp. MSK9-3]|uniref:membrane lipoprotein lipid attachment site-containing protein n=1 Tax=Pseudoalteromonas sp. MSK9-3 TaxID=1897633 RepID=UPI000E6B9CC1|nr:membrane lipoprotein lipid attachment site-containing protein [Pseudoalteromonas sp. MSK9-3]RJE77049.1 hypothetical protein BGP78_02040 [Pseudoalteromonas sp. MSK9-3]